MEKMIERSSSMAKMIEH